MKTSVHLHSSKPVNLAFFVSMPSRQVRGEYRDICFPCTPEFKQTFDQAVLDAYRMELDQGLSQHHNEAPEPDGPEMGGMSM